MRTARSLLAALLVLVLLVAGCGDDGSSSETVAGDSEAQPSKTADDTDEREDEGPSTLDLANEYDSSVAPQISALAPLLERAASVIAKVSEGQIDVAAAAAGFTRQSKDVASLATEIGAIESEHDTITEANGHLVLAMRSYAGALATLGTLSDADTEVAVDSKFSKATTQLEQAGAQVTAWQDTLLESGIDEFVFPKASAASAEVAAAAESFG